MAEDKEIEAALFEGFGRPLVAGKEDEVRGLAAIFEDHEWTVRGLEAVLGLEGFKVVEVARTMEEARNLVPRLPELGVGLAIVGGDLTLGGLEAREGNLIVKGIEATDQQIVTIGLTVLGETEIEGADHNPVSLLELMFCLREISSASQTTDSS